MSDENPLYPLTIDMETVITIHDDILKSTGGNIDLSHPIPQDLADLMEDVAEGHVTQQELARWLKDHKIKKQTKPNFFPNK